MLVTGGAGFIGSHTVVELIKAGYEVAILDNLSNSREESINRIERITGTRPGFHRADIRDSEALAKIFALRRFSAVIHFAGLKAVGESVEQPLRYYENNVGGTLTLCEAMQAQGVRTLVFSSSATVYGDPASVPIREDAPTHPTNPYGRSKMMVEEMLRDLAESEPGWSIALLRYFNPVSAHESGLIGENPRGVPNNLMPYVCQVATGRLGELRVFGSDYPTPDGTGVRDYIHIVDLALGHIFALKALTQTSGVMLANLGTGRGYSVLEVIAAFERASGTIIARSMAPRRSGDIAQCYADPSHANSRLGWSARKNLDEMCQDAWRWQSMNPEGFGEA
ncbi:MAG: UDP-glucose 4-epimerase GalE [Betaproteobacteria bacterium]|nr:UDP-glucose 4-epimerase GalE [Betaproteobacteria bacterium]